MRMQKYFVYATGPIDYYSGLEKACDFAVTHIVTAMYNNKSFFSEEVSCIYRYLTPNFDCDIGVGYIAHGIDNGIRYIFSPIKVHCSHDSIECFLPF